VPDARVTARQARGLEFALRSGPIDRVHERVTRREAISAEETRRLEQRIADLEQALAARDEFIATVGHELRNPLSPLFLQVQQLIEAQQAPGCPPSPEWLAVRLQGLATRLYRFVDTLNRLLDISRMQAGRIELITEEVDLAQVAAEVCSGMEREIRVAKSPLHVDLSRAVGIWDRLRLEQIVGNLLSNAIRYGAGHPIEVRVACGPGVASLSVRDRGIGIAEPDLDRIFERFERVSGPRTAGGFGVGLWVVRRLCRALEGEVAVQSKLGQGSLFTVTLPRSKD
jgi:signal transduction histidine kinase